MKTFNIAKNIVQVFYKIVLILCITVITCSFFNYLLVAPIPTSKIGVIMEDLNQQEDNVNVLFLGSSRTYRGIDAYTMSQNLNDNIFGISSDSVTYCSLYHLLVEIAKTNKIEKVFLEYSSINFKRITGSEDSYIFNLLSGKNQKDYNEDSGLNYKNGNLINFVNFIKNFSNGKFADNLHYRLMGSHTLGDGINTAKSQYIGNGFIYAKANVKNGANVDLPGNYFTDGTVWRESDAQVEALEYFYKIIEYCQSQNIEVVLYSPPYPYTIVQKYYEQFELFENYIQDICQNLGDIQILDFSKLKKEFATWDISYFYNANHCNGEGATLLEPILEDIYKELENDTFDSNKYFYQNYEEMINDYLTI